MATTLFRLKGVVTEDGELKVTLPKEVPPGEVNVTLEIPVESATEDADWENQPWTEEEIRELMRVEPMTGAEIVAAGLTGGWEEMGITDSVEWLEEQRRKRRKKLEW